MAGICLKRLPETSSFWEHYPWEHPPSSHKGPLPDPIKLESCITKGEAEGKQTRKWLHNFILDKIAFTECIRSLTNNSLQAQTAYSMTHLELPKMLPTEFRTLGVQDTIHMLFIIMGATGYTPKAWKTSNTILIGVCSALARWCLCS